MVFAKEFIASLDANRTVKDELSEAVSKRRGRRRIAVTDLINPRQAFHRWKHPEIEPSPKRLQLMLAGTGFHEVFGKAVSTEEFTEQFVEFNGIVGKIDVYEDSPTELKTTGFIPDDILADRPSYVDQLGMYCTMTGSPNGHLLIYKRAYFKLLPSLRAFDITYSDLDSITEEMVRRRDAFEYALENDEPEKLPRCEWFDIGCDYSDICGCESARPLKRIVPSGTAKILENEDLAEALASKLAQAPETPVGFRLNDLVFPRKTAYARKPSEDGEPDEENLKSRLKGLERWGFKDALDEAIRYGIPSTFSRVLVEFRTLRGWVRTYKGVPLVLRSVKWREMVDRKRLVEAFPHYFDRLAFECALTGNDKGRIILYYELLEDDKFMVYDVWFKDLEAIRTEAERRLALLESGAHPNELPPCPSWMTDYCDHAPECGCGETKWTVTKS